MGTKRILFLPFGDWNPDRSVYETGNLQRAENVLPLFRTYQPVRTLITVAAAVEDKITRAHAHIWEEPSPIQRLAPVSYQAIGNYLDELRTIGRCWLIFIWNERTQGRCKPNSMQRQFVKRLLICLAIERRRVRKRMTE